MNKQTKVSPRGRQVVGENDIFRPNTKENRILDRDISPLERARILIYEHNYINKWEISRLTYRTKDRDPVTNLPRHTPHYLAYVAKVGQIIEDRNSE